ncbi:hypothetical protein BDQ17DRAFT_1351525 [Cyathus striatus]|nr:hypothetical protein BDQ17DRAFT_1351525 [Cyathus striatus]
MEFISREYKRVLTTQYAFAKSTKVRRFVLNLVLLADVVAADLDKVKKGAQGIFGWCWDDVNIPLQFLSSLQGVIGVMWVCSKLELDDCLLCAVKI